MLENVLSVDTEQATSPATSVPDIEASQKKRPSEENIDLKELELTDSESESEVTTRESRANSEQSPSECENMEEEEELHKELTLSQEDWDLILQGAQHSTFNAGDVILAQGDESVGVYQIGNGICRVEVTKNDATEVIGTLGTSEMFGEVSFLRHEGASVSIVAGMQIHQCASKLCIV